MKLKLYNALFLVVVVLAIVMGYLLRDFLGGDPPVERRGNCYFIYALEAEDTMLNATRWKGTMVCFGGDTDEYIPVTPSPLPSVEDV